MRFKDIFNGAIRRLARGVPQKRRTLALPGIFTAPRGADGALPKCTPYNLRRFAETPIARKAINTIKDRVAGMRWRVQPKNGRNLEELPGGAERIRVLTDNLDAPNSDDSFRSLAEQVLEDVIVGGFGALEVQLADDPARPRCRCGRWMARPSACAPTGMPCRTRRATCKQPDYSVETAVRPSPETPLRASLPVGSFSTMTSSSTSG